MPTKVPAVMIEDGALTSNATLPTSTVIQWFPPEAALYPTSNYAQFKSVNGTNFPVNSLAFDATTDETVFFRGVVNNFGSGGLEVRLRWYADTANSGTCIWGVSIAAITANVDTQDVETKPLATEQTVTATHPGGTIHRLQEAIAIISNLDNVAELDDLTLRVTRKASAAADTMTGDAQLVGVLVCNSTQPLPAPPPPPPPAPAPTPRPAILNTRFTGVSLVQIADYSPQGKEYRFDGTDSQTSQVFSTTSPQIWGSQWGTSHLQLINNSTQNVAIDTAFQTAFTADGFQITRTIPYVGVPQCVYRLRPDAAFSNQSMVYIRGKIKLPTSLPTVDGGGIFLCEVKNNYTDQKLQMDIVPINTNGTNRWAVRLSSMRREFGIYNLWGGSMFTPYQNTTPVQDGYFQQDATNVDQTAYYYFFGAFAPNASGPAPDTSLWYTYEFAFRLQSPSGAVQGNAAQGWVWGATSVGTASAPATNGIGTQRFYLTGRNMNSEPNPGATLIFPFGHYSGFDGINNLPITWRQVEVYDYWPADASPHPAGAI